MSPDMHVFEKLKAERDALAMSTREFRDALAAERHKNEEAEATAERLRNAALKYLEQVGDHDDWDPGECPSCNAEKELRAAIESFKSGTALDEHDKALMAELKLKLARTRDAHDVDGKALLREMTARLEAEATAERLVGALKHCLAELPTGHPGSIFDNAHQKGRAALLAHKSGTALAEHEAKVIKENYRAAFDEGWNRCMDDHGLHPLDTHTPALAEHDKALVEPLRETLRESLSALAELYGGWGRGSPREDAGPMLERTKLAIVHIRAALSETADASTWLAEHDARVRKEALAEAADYVGGQNPKLALAVVADGLRALAKEPKP